MQAFEQVMLGGESAELDAVAAQQAIARSEVVHFERSAAMVDPVELRRYYDDLVEGVGEPYDIAEDFRNGGAPTGERWSEIRYDSEVPDNVAFRYSKNAQPLHTDESYVSSGAGVMLFYCVAAAPCGGETVFVSGRRLVDHLQVSAPDLLEQLRTTAVCYRKAEDHKYRPIIQVDADGTVDLNYNYYCADPDQPSEAIELNETFHRYLQDELPEDLIHPVGLRPGEAVTWRDSLVLHGRNAFTAQSSGERFIWKTGIRLLEAA